MYIAYIRSNQHIVVREDAEVHLETIFVSSVFKGLSKRDVAVLEDDKFLVERSKQMLDYDMVTELRLFNNQYHHCFQ
jgi:hypothetical protein